MIAQVSIHANNVIFMDFMQHVNHFLKDYDDTRFENWTDYFVKHQTAWRRTSDYYTYKKVDNEYFIYTHDRLLFTIKLIKECQH